MSGNANQRPNILNLAERTSVPTKRAVRAPMPKKRSKGVPLSERVTLERVLGLTVRDNRTFACDPTTGLVVYPAGCVIVLYNPRRNKQSHIFSHSRKTITALAISGDGKNVVSGEYGHKPAVRVWDVEERTQLTELHGHKFGINCVAFSPNLKYVVSVGEQHDMVVNVWNWKDGSKLAAGKISVKVAGFSFSEDGSRFVTAGNRSIRFWYMSSKSRTRETFPLNSRAGLLGEQRNNNFCSVACGLGANQSKTYAVTKSGLLCEFNEQRLLDKWVELRTSSAYSIVASEEYLFVGCADGIVRLFSTSTLNFVATLPRPHFLGVNVSDGIDPSHMITHRENARYPAAIAITYDDVSKKVTCVYNDHSLYVWDVHDVKKIGKQRSFLYHSSCIWGAEVYPSLIAGDKEALPPGSFLTFASDDTIRIWNVDPAMNTDTFKRNIYSNELLKVIYVDDQLEHLCSTGSTASDKAESATEGKNGIRCISLSADGQFLASGDRSGNVRVHDMQFMDEVHKIEAHDSEVLCLEFSRPESGYYLLASSSRDRLIHVFNMQEDCSLVQTLDDHSSSITAVKFTQCNDRLQMISCGADKALMFRVATQNPDFEFIRNHHVVGKTTIYDLTVDPTEKYVATACQDRNIRIHNAVTGKLKRTYKGSQGEDGTLIRVELDPSGMYIATSSSDKSVAIFDFYSGECVATMDGHSELVTGIKFTNDCKHLISTSGDGCIFVWRLPWGFTHNMKERLNEMGQHMKEAPSYPQLRRGTFVIPPELDPKVAAIETRSNTHRATMLVNKGSKLVAGDGEEEQEEEYEDGEGRDETDWHAGPKLDSTADLPLWAKKQVCGEDLPSPTTYSNPAQPRGRWAQRLDSKGFKVKSEWDAHRDIELKLEDGIDRRRYTVEPENLAEQAAVAEHERLQSSLLITDAEDFVSAEEGLAGLEDQRNASNPLLQGFVTSARGSDPFLPPTGHSSSSLSPDTPEDEVNSAKEEDQEEEEEEANEVIIYPPSEESSSSPESLKFQVTESTSSLEELQRRRARSVLKKESPRSSRVIEDQDLTEVEGSESTEPVSLGTSEDEDEGDEDEAEEDDNEEKGDQEKTPTESDHSNSKAQSTPGQTPTTTSIITPTDPTEGLKTNGRDSSSPKRDEDEEEEDKDEESFLHTNYGFTEQEKFGKCLEQLQSGFASVGLHNGNHHRLSISSKFLSRSQLSHIRGVAASTRPLPSSSVGGVTAQVYLQRRKDVMAKAVDETRRRLQSMGWNSLRSKSTTTPSSSGSTTSTTPTSTPTSPNKSVSTVTTVSRSEGSSMTEASPAEADERSHTVASVTESPSVGDALLNESEGSQKGQKASEDGKQEIETDQRKTESTPVVRQPENEPALTEDSRDKTQENGVMINKMGLRDSKETEESKAVQENSITSSGESASKASTIQPVTGTKDVGDNISRSKSPSTVPAETSNSQQVSQSESVVRSDDQSRNMTSTPDPVHVPIIKTKRPVSAPVEPTFEAIEKANKENLVRSFKYNTHPGRRSISSSSKSKMDKMKARKDQPATSTMRKSTSMSDLREAKSDEESRSESPSFNMVLRSHPRSHSVERKKIRANSPAREKHRSRPDRVLPLVPGLLKPKSYEVGTASSLAKKSVRKDETPPSSPSRTGRGKRSSFGAPGEESRQSKSGGSSPETLPETTKNVTLPEKPSAKDALADKTKQLAEADISSEATVADTQTADVKDVPRSSSPSSVGSQKDADLSSNKDQADKLAMPPPSSTTIAKSNRSLRRSSATRVELRQQRRRGSSSKTKPPANDASSTEDQKVSSDSISTSETSQSDARPSSPKSRGSSYRENRSSSLREGLSPKTARKASAPTIKTDTTEESLSDPSRPPLKLKSSKDSVKDEKTSEKPSPRRRRRERNEEAVVNASNNNNTMTQLDSVDKVHSPRSRSRRRRSFEASNASERTSGVTCEGTVTAKTSETEQRRESLEQCPTSTIKEPCPDRDSSEMTLDMMKAQVDTMKTAFDQCLELCAKAQGTDSPGKSHQHFLDYFASTFSLMQAASSPTLASRQSRRHPNLSVTDDTMSDVSESSLPYDDLLRSASSSSVFMTTTATTVSSARHSEVSPSEVDALRASLSSCRKTPPPNGMTGEVEMTSAIALLDQYSSILVSLVRQKVGDEMSEESAATQTQRSLDSAIEGIVNQ
ncbi:WD repeat-containing protein 62-like isoform X2 [Patiria miniata]|uniref:MABP1/WDR62 second WD40 domain-containing protein n=1 Tax=Patiria miniata TaxID=46514 RepID=A0A914BJW3_PATMI|nr:WD repeat-containing protein 62-like isoform X2 [Patiria miniata]